MILSPRCIVDNNGYACVRLRHIVQLIFGSKIVQLGLSRNYFPGLTEDHNQASSILGILCFGEMFRKNASQ